MSNIKICIIEELNKKIKEASDKLFSTEKLSLEEVINGCNSENFIKNYEIIHHQKESYSLECPLIEIKLENNKKIFLVGNLQRNEHLKFQYVDIVAGEIDEDFEINMTSSGETSIDVIYNDGVSENEVIIDFLKKINFLNNSYEAYDYKDKIFTVDMSERFLIRMMDDSKSRLFKQITCREENLYSVKSYENLNEVKEALEKNQDLQRQLILEEKLVKALNESFLLNSKINSSLITTKFLGLENISVVPKNYSIINFQFKCSFNGIEVLFNVLYRYEFINRLYFIEAAIGESKKHFEYDAVEKELYLEDFVLDLLDEEPDLESLVDDFYDFKGLDTTLEFDNIINEYFELWLINHNLNKNCARLESGVEIIMDAFVPYLGIKDNLLYELYPKFE